MLDDVEPIFDDGALEDNNAWIKWWVEDDNQQSLASKWILGKQFNDQPG